MLWNLQVLFAAVLILPGCAGDSVKPPELTTAKGVVNLDGKPAPDVTVRFVPAAGNSGNGGVGTTQADGSYTLRVLGADEEEESGIPPGAYTVIFSKYVMPDGSHMVWGIQPESVGAVEVFPAHYTDPATSEVKATVTEAGGTFDFELSSKPPAKAPVQ